VFSYPLMAGIQEISAQIGRVTGFGIAGNLRRHYPAWLSGGTVLLLLLSSNLINLGADLGAMGAAAPPCSMSCCSARSRPGCRSSRATHATSPSSNGGACRSGVKVRIIAISAESARIERRACD
jgi:hypothetical protein